MNPNITLDLLVNHRKQKKISIDKITKRSPKKVSNTLNNLKILGNNIDILTNNINKYSDNDINYILNTMIDACSRIIHLKKNNNFPITENTIHHLKKLIHIVKSRPNLNRQHSTLKIIKISSKKKHRKNK